MPAHLYQALVQAGLEKYPQLKPWMKRLVPPTVPFFIAHVEMAEILDGQALLYARASRMLTRAMRGIRRDIRASSKRLDHNAPLVELEKKIMAAESLPECNDWWDTLEEMEKELRAAEWARRKAARQQAREATRRAKRNAQSQTPRPPDWGVAARERRKKHLKTKLKLVQSIKKANRQQGRKVEVTNAAEGSCEGVG